MRDFDGDSGFGDGLFGYHDQSTGSSPNRSGSSPSNSSGTDECSAPPPVMAPTKLLAMAIKKRRDLMDEKERDYRRELLHSHLIQNLCKYLGEGRAKVRRQRRHRRKFARRWDADGGGMRISERDQVVPNGRTPNPPNPGLAIESSVQNADGGHDGTVRRWRELQIDSDHEGCESPRKKKKNEHEGYEDEFTDLENRGEATTDFNKPTSDGGRVFDERDDVLFTDATDFNKSTSDEGRVLEERKRNDVIFTDV